MPAPRPPASIEINRAPVLTLWAAVVAERLGYDRDEAATLGKALAGMNAASKARTLGLAKPAAKPSPGKKAPAPRTEPNRVELLGRLVPVVKTPRGIRAAEDGKPASAEAVHRYLDSRFGESLEAVREAMTLLARSRPRATLAGEAFSLYERFRPSIPAGVRGWGAKGVLDLGVIRGLASRSD